MPTEINFDYEEKVERALRYGFTEEDIRAVTRQGSQEHRDRIEEALRMPSVRKFRASPAAASQTALLASIAEGTAANSNAHEMSALNGRANRPIRELLDVYRDTVRETPATELPDLEPETIQRVERTLTQWPEGVTEALVHRAANLPTVNDTDPNAVSVQGLRQTGVPLIGEGMFRDPHVLDMEKLQMLRRSPPGDGFFLRDPEQMGQFMDTFRGVSAEFIPGRGVVDFGQWAHTAREMGVFDSFLDQVIGTIFHGWTNRKIRDHVVSLSTEDQIKFYRDLFASYEKSTGVYSSNWHMWIMQEGIMSDEFLASMNPQDRFETVMSNIASMAAVFEASVIGLIAARFFKSMPAAANLLWRSSPSRGRANLQSLTTRMTDQEWARRWGVNKVDVLESQLPAPMIDDVIRNLPDGIAREIDLERTAEVISAADDLSRRANASIYTTRERLGIISQTVEDIEKAHTGTLRPSMSRIGVFDDESGVRFHLMVGKDEAHGFADLAEAWAYAGRFNDPQNMAFFRVSDDASTLVPFKPKVRKGPHGDWEPVPGQTGEFFVQLRHDHYFSPLDAALFGGDPVIAGTWLGRSMRWLTTPSAHLDPDIMRKFTVGFTREQALTNAFDYITAPMFRSLTPNQRLEVNDALLWAENFGKQNGRNPSVVELRAQFPEANDQILGGYFQARLFYDTLHQVQNNRLYRAWHGQGYKTASKGGTSYHGQVVPDTEMRAFDGAVLDAETGKSRVLTPTEARELADNGSVLMRVDLPMEAVEGGALHRTILLDSTQGWRAGELSQFPLKYIPGYFTRIYKDNHFIRRVTEGTLIDGRPDRHTSTISVAATRKEADVFRAREIDRMGKRYWGENWDMTAPSAVKEARLAEKGVRIEVAADSRLTSVDRAAIDMDKFRMEGRLFFDNRLERPLADVYGNPAEILDPINSLHRTARAVSRQIAFEELIKQQKAQFFAHYKGIIPELANVEGRSAAEVSRTLGRVVREQRGETAQRAAGAKAYWDYLRSMEGSLGGDAAVFRKGMINAAEWFDLNVGWKFGREWGRTWTKDLSRNADKLDFFQGTKSLGFLHWITARPLRQWILQGAQHMHIQAIDPTYIGRWQMDSFSLLSSMRQLGRSREGRKLFTLKQSQNARQMGYSKDEFNILLDEFSKSGLVDTVDVHSFAGGMPKSATYTPTSTAGQVAQGLTDGVAMPFQKMRAFGFDMAEQYNVTASWLMALRRHKKENGITDLRKMSREDWDSVNSRGSHYALAMHRANAAEWQYGMISVPMQFLQYTHKWLFTMLGASKKMRELGLANQAFTQAEAAKIVAGQFLLFGAAGFGLKEAFREEAHKRGLPLSDEQIDFLASGSMDWMMDTMIQTLVNDPDLDFAFDDAFVPGMGFTQTLRSWQEAAFGNKHIDFLIGPGGMSASRLFQAAQTIWTISGGQIEGMSQPEQFQAVLEAAAAGVLASGSDYLKVKMAHKVGYWTNQHGVSLGPNFEAKYTELLMKGLFGVNPQKVMDYYRTNEAIRNREDQIASDAREAYNHVSRIVALWGDGKHSHQEALSMINQAVIALSVYDEPDQATFLEEFYARMKADRVENKDMFERIADILNRGNHPDFIFGILNSGMFDDEQRPLVRQMLEDAINDSEAWREREEARLWEEAEIIRSLPGGRDE